MKLKLILVFLTVLAFIFPSFALAQSTPQNQTGQQEQEEDFYRAEVLEVLEEGTRERGSVESKFQELRIELKNGPKKGEVLEITHGELVTLNENNTVERGEQVVVSELTRPDGNIQYMVQDKYRLDKLFVFAIAFILLVIAVARWKGLGSLIGLIISFVVIIKFIVPQILNGNDPLLISITGASGIMIATLYLAHGFNKKTTIALVSTMITFTFIGILAVISVSAANLSGLGSEEAYSLQYGFMDRINFSGLFLGGILIGALGVLDDVTTSLTTSIFEVAKNHRNISFVSLFKSGMEIGREHIASLVNTLVLAYAGASLPIFLFVVINPTDSPVWTILNNEMIAEEIVRVLAGSFGLVLAVPLTALIASYVANRSLKN